jgi:hypothetical protein
MSAEIDQLLKPLKSHHSFQLDSPSPQMQAPAKSLDVQTHSETDIQYEMMGRKITRRKVFAQTSQKAAD